MYIGNLVVLLLIAYYILLYQIKRSCAKFIL